ncbi:MAG TPA: hypothetical protein VIQ31_26615 [Phormidium sp.]
MGRSNLVPSATKMRSLKTWMTQSHLQAMLKPINESAIALPLEYKK